MSELGIYVCRALPATEENIRLSENYEYKVTLSVVSQVAGLEFFTSYIFKKDITFPDMNATLIKFGLNPDDYECHRSGNIGQTEVIFYYEHKVTKEPFNLKISDVVQRISNVDCLLHTTVGCHTGGAHETFFEHIMTRDNDWVYPVITSRSMLMEHWEKYFSEDDEVRAQFRLNIIDKFIEGETYVQYCL